MSFLWPDRSSSPPPSSLPPSLEESLRIVAADLSKQAKLELASQAIPVRQLKEISDDELADVRRLKAKHLGGAFAAAAGIEGDVGDFIICDNYSRDNRAAAGRSSAAAWAVPLLAAGLVIGGGGGALLWSLLSSRSSDGARQLSPQEFEVEIWMEGGKPKSKITPVPLSVK